MELQPKVDNWVRFAKNLSHGSPAPQGTAREPHNPNPVLFPD